MIAADPTKCLRSRLLSLVLFCWECDVQEGKVQEALDKLAVMEKQTRNVSVIPRI